MLIVGKIHINMSLKSDQLNVFIHFTTYSKY